MDGQKEGSPTKLRLLAPKSLFTEGVKYTPLPKSKGSKKSPHKQAVRPVLPKAPVISSPTKTTALMLKRKATLVCQRRSPVKILPKRPNIDQAATSALPRMFTRQQGDKGKRNQMFQGFPLSKRHQKNQRGVENVTPHKTVDVTVVREVAVECEKGSLCREEDAEVTVKDGDQMELMDLMAACTTIRYDPKMGAANQDIDTKSKTLRQEKKTLSLLEEDIVEDDPKKDERDTEYARDYFNRVKQVLKDNPDHFKQFLTCLHFTNKQNCDPVQLYKEIASILHDHQDLVDDFAAFLLPHQAVQCGCFVPCLQYHQLREFLRKLEIFCEQSSVSTFHTNLKKISKWLTASQEVHTENISYKEKLSVSKRFVPSVLDESLDYFLDGPIPDSYFQPEEFEDVDLDATPDKESGFEELTLPDRRETYSTRRCGCHCHKKDRDEDFKKRKKHCFSCSLKLRNGLPILKIAQGKYRPVTVIYPHEEREKARREAAQLALAKAKAQRSKTNRNKTKGSSHAQNSRSKSMVFKRKQKKKVPMLGRRKTVCSSDGNSSKSQAGTLPVDVKFDTNQLCKTEEDNETLDFVPCGLLITRPTNNNPDSLSTSLSSPTSTHEGLHEEQLQSLPAAILEGNDPHPPLTDHHVAHDTSSSPSIPSLSASGQSPTATNAIE